jgi:hypothetical protein
MNYGVVSTFSTGYRMVHSKLTFFLFFFCIFLCVAIFWTSIPHDFSSFPNPFFAENASKGSILWKEGSAGWEMEEVKVHLVKIYPTATPSFEKEFCFLECVALLSVVKKLKPKRIFLHSNLPSFWPLASCQFLQKNLSLVQMVPLEPVVSIGGKKIDNFHHQADIAKLQILRDHGGIVLDMDVFMINGHFVWNILRKYDCMLSQEGSKMLNAGFAACRKASKWPNLVLDLYKKDYRKDWYYNSAILPFNLYRSRKDLQKTIYVDDTISDNPEGKEGYKMLDFKGLIDWRRKVAFQSFYHNCKLGIPYANTSQTSFGELLRWILYDTEPLSS